MSVYQCFSELFQSLIYIFKHWFLNLYQIIIFFPRKIILFIRFDDLIHYMPTLHNNFIVFISLCLVFIILLWYSVLRKVRSNDIIMPSLRSISSIVPRNDKPRFRKRDKIRYYATRLNRKFQDLTGHLQNIKSKDQKQKLMSLFAKNWLFGRKRILNLKEKAPKLLQRTLPDAFLEPDIEEDDNILPEEFQLILDSIKVFGHLEKSFLLEICKSIQTIKLDTGQFLFKKGDMDDNVFVVKSGKIRVYIDEKGESKMTIHEVQRGGNIHSLLSVLDVITGNIQEYKSVHAAAVMPSEVLQLKAQSFVSLFQQSPDSMVRIVQLIATRLQRVTFLCLHNYLGLSSELINKVNLALPNSRLVEMSSKMPNLSNKAIIRELSGGVDMKSNAKKSGTKSGIQNEDTFTKVTEEKQESRSVSQSPTGQHVHPIIGTNAENKFLFAYETMEEDAVPIAGVELEYGETPGANLTSPSLANIMRKGSLGEDRIRSLYHRKYRAASLFTDVHVQDNFNSSELLQASKEDIAQILGLNDIGLLSNLKISLVPGGTVLVSEGEEDTDAYFVVTGELHVLQYSVRNDHSKMASLFVTHPGELCGVETLITTEPSFYTIKAINPTRVVVIPRDLLYSLIKGDPNILLKLSNLLVRRMSPFLRQIDFALEWSSVKAGLPLYKTGDMTRSVYIILNGRFRQICVKPDGSRAIVNELGRGELLGFVEVLSDQPSATTVMAIRDSEVAQMPTGLLSWIKRKAPHVVTRLIQLLADKLLVSMSGQSSSVMKGPVGTMGNLRTVAVVASSFDVPLEAFVLELQHAMIKIGPSVRLTSSIILKRLGSKALDPMNEYRLASWLSQQEDVHRMVFYVCDNYANSVWTRRCIRQADCLLVVALANKEPKLGSIELGIESDQTKVTKILVLLYPIETEYPQPGKTSEWLNLRPWITQNYHIRCPRRVFIRRKTEKLVVLYKRIFEKETPNPHSDMSRLARYLTGTAVGLVLGGGGARGCSHVGAIRAMHEAGIPIDIIGGTSIGAFMGGLWAEETRVTQFTQRARAYAKEMTSVWKMVLDLTYSPVSLFSGRAMNTTLEKIFKDRQIEDLWLPYFCITTDITNSKMRVHTNGSMWRFVRASMSLSGYLPPLCHPDDGSLLLDGGYVNNLPADIMQDMEAELIFAIDVGSHDDTDLTNYGDWLSGGKLLYHKYISRDPMKILNLTEIQSRLAYVSCVRHMEQVKNADICVYMRPPILHYKTLQFGSFDEIQEVGYSYTVDRITEWQANKNLNHFVRHQLNWLDIKQENIAHSNSSIKKVNVTHTKPLNLKEYVLGSSTLDINQKKFIDLAELVSRIGQEEDDLYESDNDDFLSDYLAQVKGSKMVEDVLFLSRSKISSQLNFEDSKDYVDNNNFSQLDYKEINLTDQSNINCLNSRDLIGSRINKKNIEGFDEDLEDDDHNVASDPENFFRVLISTHKRRHRRCSLNRLHKSVTFGDRNELN